MAIFDDDLTPTDLELALSTKANVDHVHPWSSITGKPAAFVPVAHSHAWSDISDKPTSFPAAPHPLGSLSDVDAGSPQDGYVLSWNQTNGAWQAKALSVSTGGSAVAWADVTGKPSVFTPEIHGHTWSDITGKPATFTPSAHSHAWSSISGKPAHFPPSAHSHALGDLSNVDAGAPTDGYILTWDQIAGAWQAKAAPEGGAVAWADLVDKPATFAPSPHDHPVNRIKVTADHSAVAEQRVAVNTQAGPVTITAPVAPGEGAYFRVSDAGANAATHPITIDFGAASFRGGPDTEFVINMSGLKVGFYFTAGTWEVFD